MNSQQIRPLYSLSLVVLDSILIVSGFVIAFILRKTIPFPNELASDIPVNQYSALIGTQVICIVGVLFFYGQYHIPRAVSRVDQLYAVVASVTIGSLLAIGVAAIAFKNNFLEVDYSRVMLVYAWFFTINFIMLGRTVHGVIRDAFRDRGLARDRLLVVGSDEVARIILQRIIWSPQLGYEVVGVVSDNGISDVLGIPVLGKPEDLPELIESNRIDEVIVAMPEKGHRETMRVVSFCERGRVSIKVFPDIFQFIASEASIDDLGGLPLLSIRDFAMRGYKLIFKRFMDVAGSISGLVFLSPIMLFIALAIKLESPGPVFFVQERMGLDGHPFQMFKFRSMRSDAERDGPAWTVDDDPRQTRLGRLIRAVDVDELPQLINVLLGEMSLVGPRPEQPYYVDQFRGTVPHYMERHREKSGMTGWAQVNGLRGDTSIVERTKYDIWYTENWSVLLDVKIMMRTFWQLIIDRRP